MGENGNLTSEVILNCYDFGKYYLEEVLLVLVFIDIVKIVGGGISVLAVFSFTGTINMLIIKINCVLYSGLVMK